MWIIASLPLWIIGIALLLLGLFGLHLTIKDYRGQGSTFAGGTLMVLIGSAIFLAIAAKVAS
ncbi:hypothetical protein [Bradyrhizobium sp. sGM-13]|uniref:hypothetical protein n=1 Tax=Bradyrhizobium sp. sGM-13 TaxID=2831781 RepID=UPI001BCCB0A1|nr:hypothetical protein [Bradyrhizobium sp. sGM-13]